MSLYLNKSFWYIFAVIFLCCASSGFSQDKTTIDSLENVYLTQNLSIAEQMTVLNNLAGDDPDPSTSYLYSDKLLFLAESQDSVEIVLNALQYKGNALTIMGDLSEALGVFMEGVGLAEEIKDNEVLGQFYLSIAGVYSVMDNNSNAFFIIKSELIFLKILTTKEIMPLPLRT